ncbi:MAG: DNA-formamidopyrimidine glycosylase family protein [Armatimonadota bacterium]
MPELPSLESFRNYVNSTSLYKDLDSIDVSAPEMLEGVTEDRLASVLGGTHFTDTFRHGKYLFLKTARDGWLILHFGMTGFPRYYEVEESAPEHQRFIVNFDDGYHLAYDCQRKLGQVSVTDDRDVFIADQDLGPDALRVGWEAFKDTMTHTRGMIKTRLMDQSKVAGIGNVWSDEVLFQMKLPPRAKIGDLNGDGLRELYDTMKQVLQTAAECVIQSENLPAEYLAGHREPGSECPVCGGEIKRIEIGGRGARYCPNCQAEA